MDSINQKIREHITDMGVTGKLIRARAVEEQLTDIEIELTERKERLEKQQAGTVEHAMNKKMILALIAQRKKLLREFEYSLAVMIYQVADQKHEGITREEIERARTYPIESMIEVRRGIAQCISGSHKDKHPSMDVRNNFCYCYACGWNADPIDVAMKLWGLNFQDAVRRLQ